MAKQRLVIGEAPRRTLPAPRLARVLLVLAVLGLIIGRLFFVELVAVHGNTMAPNILDGDVLLVSRRTELELGAVVLIEHEDSMVLRRIIGLPGERIGSRQGVLTRAESPVQTRVSGNFAYRDSEEDARPRRQQELEETLPDGRSHALLGDHVGAARPWLLEVPDVEVPPGHLFVLCDNRRTCPLDERSGLVPMEWVHGVAGRLMWYGSSRVEPIVGPFYGAFEPLKSQSDEPSSEAAGGAGPPRK